MAKLTINLTNKYFFIVLSGLCFIWLIIHITIMSGSIDITGMDKLLYFVIIILCTFFFWVPFQYNEKFT